MFGIWFWIGLVIATTAVIAYELKSHSRSPSISKPRGGNRSVNDKIVRRNSTDSGREYYSKDGYDVKAFLKYVTSFSILGLSIFGPLTALIVWYIIDPVMALVNTTVIIPSIGFLLIKYENSRKERGKNGERLSNKPHSHLNISKESKFGVLSLAIPLGIIAVTSVVQFYMTVTFGVATLIIYGLLKTGHWESEARAIQEGDAFDEDAESYGALSRQSCAICRKTLTSDQDLHRCQSCGTDFHLNCIFRWIELKHRLCPHCGGSLGYIG